MGKDFFKKNLPTMSKRGGSKAAPAKPTRFDAEKFARPGLSVDEVEEMKEAFDLFDNDNSGAISVNELTSAMQALGFDVKHAVVFNMVADLDADGSGEIEFGEFLDVMCAKISDKNTMDEIDRVFKLFDKDRNGTLEADDLSRVLKELGEEIPEEDVREIIQRADLDGDGVVNLQDFYNVLTKKTFE